MAVHHPSSASEAKAGAGWPGVLQVAGNVYRGYAAAAELAPKHVGPRRESARGELATVTGLPAGDDGNLPWVSVESQQDQGPALFVTLCLSLRLPL
jgi:hypothetical protein